MIYKVKIIEKQGEVYFVEAGSEEEARKIIDTAYWNNELYIGNFLEYEIKSRRMPDDGIYVLFNGVEENV